MRARHSLPILAALVALLTAALFSTGVSARTGDEHVELTPAEGTSTTTFIFTGSGFTPGRTVSARFYPPDVLERRIRTEDGAEIVWQVDADGTFTVEFVPALWFPSAPPGRWHALFCAFGDRTCELIEFDVLPAES